MNSLRNDLKLYFIMGSTNCRKDPRMVLEEAIAGGITLFQFREKGDGALSLGEKFTLGKDLQAICRSHHIPFIVNDDIELALALDADGVHIGQEDEPVEKVRAAIGDKILGVSVHSLNEAWSSLRDGADYFGIGPVFPTKTKADVRPTQGTTLIGTLRDHGFTLPMVGIGGITSENAGMVMAAGADGVSVITAISHADSPLEAAKSIKESLKIGGAMPI